MKRLLLAGAAFLGLTALGSGARATLFDFTYSGSLVDFPVPTTDTYQILAFGAQGGSGQCHFCIPAVSGGAEDISLGGSGGGGGYSGGGGGRLLNTRYPGGNGGSFDAGIDQILVAATLAADSTFAATSDQSNGASAAHCTIAASFPKAIVAPIPRGNCVPNETSVSMPFIQ